MAHSDGSRPDLPHVEVLREFPPRCRAEAELALLAGPHRPGWRSSRAMRNGSPRDAAAAIGGALTEYRALSLASVKC